MLNKLTLNHQMPEQLSLSLESIQSYLLALSNTNEELFEKQRELKVVSDLTNILLVTSQVLYRQRNYLGSLKFLIPLLSIISIES